MKIYNEIKKRINSLSKPKVAKQLGYNSNTHGIKALDKFLSCGDLYNWLNKSGFYDFRYNSTQLLKKICEIVDISKEEINKELLEQEAYKREIDKFEDSYIFVNTNFRRKNEPIFALAFCEPGRRIKIDPKEFVYKTDAKILQIVSKVVAKHYIETDGTLQLWGKIVNYAYYHSDGKTYIFNPDGQQVKDAEVMENIAILTIR